MPKTPKTTKGKAKAKAIQKGYRSGLEEKTGEYLTKLGVDYEYEAHKIKWVDYNVRKYTPDFFLPNGIIIETKGRFTAADRKKHLKIQEQHPLLDIRFVFSNANNRLYKGSGTMYRQWCERNHFKWANKEIPTEWIDEPEVDFRIEEIRYD